MKTALLTILVLLTFVLPVKSQTDTFALHTYGLAGPVRTVRTETATIVERNGHSVEGPRILSMTITFNEDINRTEVCFYDAIGVLSRRIVNKYDGKRDTEYLNYTGKGNIWLRGTSEYDEKGQRVGGATYYGDGTLRSRSFIKRNNYGQVVEYSTVDPNGTLLEKFVTSYGDDAGILSIERSYYRPDGSLRSRELFNAKTRRLETMNYNPDGTLAGSSVHIDQNIKEYGKNGALTKSIQVGDIGLLLDESTFSANGSSRRVTSTPDELDSHGNWIKQTKWVSDRRGRRAVSITYREITYY